MPDSLQADAGGSRVSPCTAENYRTVCERNLLSLDEILTVEAEQIVVFK